MGGWGGEAKRDQLRGAAAGTAKFWLVLGLFFLRVEFVQQQRFVFHEMIAGVLSRGLKDCLCVAVWGNTRVKCMPTVHTSEFHGVIVVLGT